MQEEQTYREVGLEESLLLHAPDYKHAAHVMLYTKWDDSLYGRYPFKYAVMMQMRFDGMLGFPGGLVDKGESPEQAVTREVCEEVGVEGVDAADGIVITRPDHVLTQVSDKTGFCLHFYAKCVVDMATIIRLETRTLRAKEWGSEVLGLVRCPLYTLPNGLGFPAFLGHNFIGSSKKQLLESVKRCGLLSAQEVAEAVATSQRISGVVTKDEVDY